MPAGGVQNITFMHQNHLVTFPYEQYIAQELQAGALPPGLLGGPGKPFGKPGIGGTLYAGEQNFDCVIAEESTVVGKNSSKLPT